MNIEHEKKVKKCILSLLQKACNNRLTLNQNLSNTLRSGEYKQKTEQIDLSKFDQIITIDRENQIAIVEPKITFEKLVNATLKYGLIPPVVPEFKTITVGGAINGAALETTSHKYGQFNDICIEYEILLGDGRLIKANKDTYADLFYGISGSYGTLGVITLVTLKLIKAPKAVRLTLSRFSSASMVIEKMQKLVKKENRPEILEGGAMEKNWAVLITGTYTDSLPRKHFKQKWFWDPWYYQQIAKITKNHSHIEVDIPLKDYLFRFDRGAFWMGRFLLSWKSMFKILFKWALPKVIEEIKETAKRLTTDTHPSFLFRFLFGKALSSQNLYRIWHKAPKQLTEKFFFIHDFYTPAEKAKQGFKILSEKTGIFPIWLCPVLGTTTDQWLAPHYSKEEKMFINIGVYGVSPNEIPASTLTKECEERINLLGGRKMLYSNTYFSKELFARIYDLNAYEKLRQKYSANNTFLTLYDKLNRFSLKS